MEDNEKKNIIELNRALAQHTHLTRLKNEYISFLLKEIKAHSKNLNEAHSVLSQTALNITQQVSADKIFFENEHSNILIEEIQSFLDLDVFRYGLNELQFDFKDYFDKRKNNNLLKSFAKEFPLNILFLEDDLFNIKYARIIFECLGYQPDFSLSLADGNTKVYDVVFVDLTNEKHLLQEKSDTIYAYFSDKKRVQIIALSPEDISDEQKSCFQHVIDWNLIFPVKIKDLTEMLENVWKKSQLKSAKPEPKPVVEIKTGKFIEEENISFIQEIQSEEDIVFFIELIDIFIIETPKIFKVIREAIKKLDYDKIHFCGHKLRGSSLTMGIELFIKIGAQLEIAANEKNIVFVEELVSELEHKFPRIMEELEDLKERYRIKYLGDFN